MVHVTFREPDLQRERSRTFYNIVIINRNIFIHCCTVVELLVELLVKLLVELLLYVIINLVCELDITTGYGPRPRVAFALLDNSVDI